MSSTAASKHKEEEEEDEDDNFYDCQETVGRPDQREEEQKQEGGETNTELLNDGRDVRGSLPQRGQEEQEDNGNEEEEEQEGDESSGRLQEEQNGKDRGASTEIKTDRTDPEGGRQDQMDQSDRLQEEQQQEEQGDRLQEEQQQEEQYDRLQEHEESDAELKEGGDCEVEFDDEYLSRVEEDLTNEEKESRRQQSLSLKERGNTHFKSGEWLEAEQSYKEGLLLCPVCFRRERAVLFSNRAAARLHLELKDQALADCSRAIALDPTYTRALQRRAELYEQTEKLDEALEDYNRVLELEPSNSNARAACMRLPGQIQERNEKLKDEMISKLKDLGNLVLRPFGLSTGNFQVNQDAQTGSYSINFVQGPKNNNNT